MQTQNESQTKPNSTIEIDSKITEITTHPSLPALYFDEINNTTPSHTFPSLCSELETNILSFLSWGDHAHLAAVHSPLKNIVKDAGEASSKAKWTLAQSLLKGENGMEVNTAQAMEYLIDLTGIGGDVDVEEFDPNYHDLDLFASSDIDENAYAVAAMRQLAKCNLYGSKAGCAPDQKKGLAWLSQAYQHGDLDSAYETAVIYEYGKYDIDVDIYLAAKWFRGAAKAGHVESMAEYAMCLELGCGVEQSDTEALDWYQRAAELGHVTANYSVGEWFESARGGLPQSDTEAVLWYFKAASMGDEDSKLALRRLSDIARIVVPGWARTLNV